jgi:CDP-diacylglycerol---serine O-phosphatidyltransferase
VRIRISRSIVPNFFTVLNIFFGFSSMILSAHGQYTLAGLYIIFGAFCDTLDGLMARLTRSASEFGVELDSLADVVTFGVAPSFLFYELFLRGYGPLGTMIAACQLVFGAIRLARFNVQLVGFSKDYFVGLPIPFAALTLVSFLFLAPPRQIASEPLLQYVLIGCIIACGLLMVSTIRYPVLPKPTPRTFKTYPFHSIAALAAAVLVAVTAGKALFPVFVAIILYGIVRSAYASVIRFLRERRDDVDDAGEHNPTPVDTHP